MENVNVFYEKRVNFIQLFMEVFMWKIRNSVPIFNGRAKAIPTYS